MRYTKQERLALYGIHMTRGRDFHEVSLKLMALGYPERAADEQKRARTHYRLAREQRIGYIYEEQDDHG
jgi:hypothetical protein